MPALLHWLLALLPTNPICMRLVQGGSRRLRHLYVRSGYLAILMVILLISLLATLSNKLMSLFESRHSQFMSLVAIHCRVHQLAVPD